MNLRIAKEFRAVLPAFGLTLAAPLLLLVEPHRAEAWVLTLFALGCILMGALAFGHEFQHRTAPLLLTQPVPRASVWKEKTQVLAATISIGTGVLGVALSLFDRRVFDPEFQWLAFGLVPLCAFCATPLWALICRNTLMAALLSLLTPGAILMAVGLVFEELLHSPRTAAISGLVLLLAYCAVSWWLGYAMFRELQVVGSVEFSRELVLPPALEARFLRPFRVVSARFKGPFTSLVKKELRLQQINFIGAALFFVVAVMGAFVYLIQTRFHWQYPLAEPILGADFAIYMILLPLLAGALSVAEEKSWGVADWHATLPPSSLKQWSAKMAVALSTSLILGLLLPAALVLAGSALFGAEEGIPPMHILVVFVVGQLLLTSLVIYAASLSRNTVGAIILALGMILVAGSLIRIILMVVLQVVSLYLQAGPHPFVFWWESHISEGEIIRPLAAGMLIFVCLLQLFAFVCYRRRALTFGQITFQALVLVLAVCLLTLVFLI